MYSSGTLRPAALSRPPSLAAASGPRTPFHIVGGIDCLAASNPPGSCCIKHHKPGSGYPHDHGPILVCACACSWPNRQPPLCWLSPCFPCGPPPTFRISPSGLANHEADDLNASLFLNARPLHLGRNSPRCTTPPPTSSVKPVSFNLRRVGLHSSAPCHLPLRPHIPGLARTPAHPRALPSCLLRALRKALSFGAGVLARSKPLSMPFPYSTPYQLPPSVPPR